MIQELAVNIVQYGATSGMAGFSNRIVVMPFQLVFRHDIVAQLLPAAHHVVYLCQQNFGIERLGNIVVGPAIEALYHAFAPRLGR